MKGIIITNAFDKNPVQIQKANRMAQELSLLGVEVEILSNDNFVAYVKEGNVICNIRCDFVLYFDKDKYIGQLLEKSGIRVFNTSQATALCDDKMQTHVALAGHVAMPTTLSGALCYTPNGIINKHYLQKAVDTLGLPLVVKQCYGSFGEQVYLAQNFEQLQSIVQKIKHTNYIFQQYVQKSSGKDLRVIAIGKQAVCAILRQNANDFRSNVALGGVGVAVQITPQIAQICQKVATVLDLDYCGIDILLGDEPLVCEVNSNAMFDGMELATGINVAKLYAQHIVNTVKNHKGDTL